MYMFSSINNFSSPLTRSLLKSSYTPFYKGVSTHSVVPNPLTPFSVNMAKYGSIAVKTSLTKGYNNGSPRLHKKLFKKKEVSSADLSLEERYKELLKKKLLSNPSKSSTNKDKPAKLTSTSPTKDKPAKLTSFYLSNSQVKAKECIPTKTKYALETYHRSNQDTCLVHRPAVFEGQWVEAGDLLADCSSSSGGELSLGQNILVAYMPWEGYNYEDAILISQRLVFDDIYTSVHIERYEIDIKETAFGPEEITKNIPSNHITSKDKSALLTSNDTAHLDANGIAKLGSWVEEGTILVGKITPEKLNKNDTEQSPYKKLLYKILDKKEIPFRDSSVRAPRGVRAKVIDVQVTKQIGTVATKQPNPDNTLNKFKKLSYSKTSKDKSVKLTLPYFTKLLGPQKQLNPNNTLSSFLTSKDKSAELTSRPLKWSVTTSRPLKWSVTTSKDKPAELTSRPLKWSVTTSRPLKWSVTTSRPLKWSVTTSKDKPAELTSRPLKWSVTTSRPLKWSVTTSRPLKWSVTTSKDKPAELTSRPLKWSVTKVIKDKSTELTSNKLIKKRGIKSVKMFLAEKRRIQVGDKMSGRHGNKGIVSQILPMEDMPFLPDGTPLDIVLNPLGVPSRMNVGQIYECLLGLAGKYLGEHYSCGAFDEMFGSEASRSFVFAKLFEARKKTGLKWLFNPNWPGKMRLFDGRTGDCFDQPVTVGQTYMLRLVHMVDDKLHFRNIGPYSLVTQQPLRGRSKQGGQRLGEMEVWALEGYGAAFTLLEMLTLKSDDIVGRMTLWSNLILNKDITLGTPESFKVLVSELKALCLDVGLFKYGENQNLKEIDNLMNLP
uniref:RNA polymerase subunit beta 2 n=1 Tax=Leontynka pallida TaxID=2912034 RepID=UPI0020298AD5|nr:RNA polymerase subunit beta 2 [Leontynka pallida]UPQ43844.1 RNA polymerase subunit beta 2 [Leontynka pallida]